MPSFNIHLAVAIKYCENHMIENKEEFFKGNIAPDLVTDKSISHYTGMRDKNFLRQFVFEKVRLNEFLKENNVESDFEKGVFLHLATDFIFYQEILSDEYLASVDYDKMIQDINAKTSIIQQQDQQLELRLKQLDTEQKALTTEMEAVKKVVTDNIEASFKTFGG